MWCPACGSEYVATVIRCADCGAALVDTVPADPRPEPRRSLGRRIVRQWPFALGGFIALVGFGIATAPSENDASLGLEVVFGIFLIVVAALVAGLGWLATKGFGAAGWALVLLVALFLPPQHLIVLAALCFAYLLWRGRARHRSRTA